MKPNAKTKFYANAALFAAALIWGSSFIVVKSSVNAIDPLILLGFRFTIGAAALSLIFIKRFKNMNLETLARGSVIGLFLFAGYAFQTFGIADTTPGKNAFLTAVYCVLVPFMFWAVYKKRPDKYNIIAAIMCIAGIGLVSLQSDFTIGLGDSLTLISGIFYAAQVVAIAKFSRNSDPVLLTIIQFAVSAALAWIIGIPTQSFPSVWTPETIGGILFLGLFATGAAILLQNVGQKYTEPAPAAIILSLEAVFGVLFSVLFYGEELTAKIIIGFALIFVAVIVSETKLSFLKRKKELPPTE